MSAVVVIGAGLSGLSAACHLIGQGRRVVVLEREAGPGGRGLRVEQDGFTFDLGPTVMTMPELLDEPLRAAGSSQQEAVPMRRLDPGYRGLFADGSELRVRDTTAGTAAEIERLAGAADARAFEELESFLRTLYETELPHFIDKNFRSPLDLLAHPRAAARLVRMGAFGTLGRLVNSRVADERVRRMLSFQALYAGLSPTTALGVYAVITYMDTMRGVYLPDGGMGAIADGMADVVARQADVRYGTTVTAVLRRKDGSVAGVDTDAGTVSADAIVCTLDTPVAYRELLGWLRPPRAVRRPVYSPSAAVWHVGVRGALPDGVAHHNVHFGRAWEQCFTELVDQGRLMSDPARLVTVSSLGEPSLAPPGAHTLYVLEPVPNLDGAVDWDIERAPLRERLHAFLSANGYPDDIVTERLVTPVEWRDLGMGGGTPFGLAHLFRQTGPFRPANQEPRVPGLFFAGSSTVPGVGVPMVLISGKLAAQRVAGWLGGARGAA
ncbi:phytoene desaturase family protein [Nigerium massiliense]|uniref:phytoene desaturase family protein n=1 Tax=Nigerium massiliense TaxID=1522317 RepID=UPI00058D91DD|nr:phytoene desaturase family protein [Nigerium massiliense]